MGFFFSILPGIFKALIDNWKAINSLIQFIEAHQDAKVRANAMDAISRGFQDAKETGDTSQLEKAIREHCTSIGCRIS